MAVVEKTHSNFISEAHALLDAFHLAAARGDAETYLASFWHRASFIGTDKSEVWSLEQFKELVDQHFRDGKGWEYASHNRVLTYDSKYQYAWFFEELKSEKYCDARGSGAMRLEDGKWVILQYVMSFAVPNPLVESLTQQVRTLEV